MHRREFSLQIVLSHKEKLEDICKMELAEIEAAYIRESGVLEKLGELERLGYEGLEHQHRLVKLDLDTIGVSFYDLQALRARIERQLQVLQSLTEKCGRKREELVEISKGKKALEKLKERHDRKLAQATIRTENKTLEDIVTSQFHRRRAG